HLLEPPVPPRKRRPDLDIPADVEAVCLRALEKDRDKRWPDMDTFYRALGAAGGLPFEPSSVFVAPKAGLRYPALAETNPLARDSKTAIASSPPHGTFEDERPVRLETPSGSFGPGAKLGAIVAAVAIAGIVAVVALRSGRRSAPAAEASVAAAPPA